MKLLFLPIFMDITPLLFALEVPDWITLGAFRLTEFGLLNLCLALEDLARYRSFYNFFGVFGKCVVKLVFLLIPPSISDKFTLSKYVVVAL